MKTRTSLAAILAVSVLFLAGCPAILDILGNGGTTTTTSTTLAAPTTTSTTSTSSTSSTTTTTIAPAGDATTLSDPDAASGYDGKLAVASDGREYIVVNRIMNSIATQTLGYEEDGDFEITEHTGSSTTGPVSFPSIFIGNNNGHVTADSNLPVPNEDLASIQSTWTWSRANAPSADCIALYELWFISDPAVGAILAPEKILSIWLSTPGAHAPSGSLVGSAALGGRTWNVWKDGSNISYVAQSTVTSVNFDLLAFIDDAIPRNTISNSDNLHDIIAGFKIWSGGAGLASSGFTALVE